MEILAPAGSILSLKAAIHGGANAVYLGLGEHNARVKSNDFTTDNLREWVSYAHLFGVKVYLTLNTAVKEQEIDRVLTLAKRAADSGVDALIVSDLGITRLLARSTDLPLHLSTQAGVQNELDASLLPSLGVKRVILSRESLLEDIPRIKRYVDEVEIFAQGAMCVCFSGGCLLGSHVFGQSGNRGVCNQACRLQYVASDASGKMLKEGRLLSPADLSLGAKVRELNRLGVDSIKIEGRLKRPAYVYAATKYYRDLLDEVDASDDLRDLSESFNRGYTDGYTICKSKRIINERTSSHIGVPVGRVESVCERKGYVFAQVSSDYHFAKGDGAKILRDGIEVGGSDVTSVKRIGALQEIPVSRGVKMGDEVCLTTNGEKIAAAEQIKNRLPIDLSIFGEVGKPIVIVASYGEISVEGSGTIPAERARSKDNGAILEKITQVGDTDFSVHSISDRTTEALFLPLAEVKDVRRRLLVALREKIIENSTPHYSLTLCDREVISDDRPIRKILEVLGAEDIASIDADAYVLTPQIADDETIRSALDAAQDKPCYLRLPKILRNAEIPAVRAMLERFPLRIFADNLYGVALARELGRGYIAGFGLNVFNTQTAAFFRDADHVCASTEFPLFGDLIFSAGKMPLMSFAHCPISVAYGVDCSTCGKRYDRLYYRDRDNRYLILRRESVSCDFVMYEDRITRKAGQKAPKSRFYSVIGLNLDEKRDMMKIVSEDRCE